MNSQTKGDVDTDLLSQPLPAEVRRQLGRIRGAFRAHQLHPGMAVEAGRKGGQASVKANPSMRTSAHGRRLSLAKRGKWVVGLAEQLAKEAEDAGD